MALSGSHFGASLDWGQGAALGGLVSAAIKAVTPDSKGSGDAN
ncbi:hypothetical protein [Paludibacterium denitrificans]|nr:hypothetical protein [Paludibacterium denitrificans]